MVAELFESGQIAESRVACSSGSAAQRLGALLRTISNLHRDRLANHRHLHELMAAAVGEGWPAALSNAERLLDLISTMIAAGQACEEFRPASPKGFACCLMEAMNVHLSPLRLGTVAPRPAFDQMLEFCMAALRGLAPLPNPQ